MPVEHRKNPFRVGCPIPPADAVGRDDELHDLLDHCRTGQSSGIVGDPRIGKSTLLGVLRHHLIKSPEITVVDIDGHSFTSATREDFWHACFADVLGEKLCELSSTPSLRWPAVVQQTLVKSAKRLLILVDEFDAIASHPVIGGSTFLQQLRSVTYHHDRIAMVTASRQSLIDLTNNAHWAGDDGSEPFNHFAEHVLGPLDDSDANKLLSRGSPLIDQKLKDSLRAVTGNHPYLLQSGASRAWRLTVRQLKQGECINGMRKRVQQDTERMMRTLWSTWKPAQRRAFVSMALKLAGGRTNLEVPWDLVPIDGVRILQRRGTLTPHRDPDADPDTIRVTNGAMTDWALQRVRWQPPDADLEADLDVIQRKRWQYWAWSSGGMQAPCKSRPYQVAFTFAGEDRDVVLPLVQQLKEKGVRVFYDEFEESNLWGRDLYSYLSEVYQKMADYCVMVISQDYEKKTWTNHERKAAQARAFTEEREYILPLRLDDTEIPGVQGTIGYVDYRKRSQDDIVKLLVEKLGVNGEINSTSR